MEGCAPDSQKQHPRGGKGERETATWHITHSWLFTNRKGCYGNEKRFLMLAIWVDIRVFFLLFLFLNRIWKCEVSRYEDV